MDASKRPPLSNRGIGRAFFRRPPVEQLCLATLLIMMAGTSALQADQTNAALEPLLEAPNSPDVDEFYEDSNADYPDDGSRALLEGSGEIVLEPLTPIEERGLLGDWGDSDDEAED